MNINFIAFLVAITGVVTTFLVMLKIHSHELSKLPRYYEIRERASQLSEKIATTEGLHRYPNIQKLLNTTQILAEIRPLEYRSLKLPRKKRKLTKATQEKQVKQLFDKIMNELEAAPTDLVSYIIEQYSICDSIIAINNPIYHFIQNMKKNQKMRKLSDATVEKEQKAVKKGSSNEEVFENGKFVNTFTPFVNLGNQHGIAV